ncbi:hypothetical protein DdX_01326 [Ditylenchus destructor]|uniref:Uncharacterized protein n=1 Tax=Ditylenchus destructor TaxID=166010 RepID=A0AAD4NJ14_9BILA|nr:hypothetical protein DdX_01326 [Ditylenchus destructor]
MPWVLPDNRMSVQVEGETKHFSWFSPSPKPLAKSDQMLSKTAKKCSARSAVIYVIFTMAMSTNGANSWGSSEGDSESRQKHERSAILSRFGRAGNSAVLSRYGKRSPQIVPHSMESPLLNMPSSPPSIRIASLTSQSPKTFELSSNHLFLCRQPFNDILRCLPYSSMDII